MSVVMLDSAKQHLNITVGTYDGELQSFLDRAEAAYGRRIGPLAPTAKTERVRGGTAVLRLSFTPIISLTSVTSIEGSTIATSQLTSLSGGRVEYSQGGYFASRFYDVVYQAGRTSLGDDLKMDVLELVRRLWSASQRGPTRRPGSDLGTATVAVDSLLGSWVDELAKSSRPVLGA